LLRPRVSSLALFLSNLSPFRSPVDLILPHPPFSPFPSLKLVNNGAVVPDPGSSLISSGYLNPVKSRMQLQLAIATGMSAEETKQAFEGVLSGYLS
jgi:hypothetical protein